MIKVGDIVRVTNWGEMYDTNANWIEKHHIAGDIPLKYVIHYSYGNHDMFEKHPHDDDTKYQVLYTDDEKALIARPSLFGDIGKVYLLGINGIEEYKTEMTVAEIEKKLGITNLKIVKEK